MWKILRPDSIEILDNKRARAALKRYFSVLEGGREPNVKSVKSVEAEVRMDEPDEALWEEHDRLVSTLQDKIGPLDIRMGKPSLLDLKIELANRMFTRCTFCERKCKVDRREKTGKCRAGAARISSMFHHYGEEPELVPSYTIFFSGCNFHCQFCQNYDISQRITGIEVSPGELAEKLEEVKARNMNWVGGEPTPNVNFILETMKHYSGNMPSVWNSNMYMSVEAMKLLSGTQDIFLTDFKYGNDECAERLSKVKKYSEIVRRNHKMAKDHAELIVRHLVLPNHIECCTSEVARFVSEELGTDTRFNLMFQYRPTYKSFKYPEISRTLDKVEKSRALQIVEQAGLSNVIL